MVSEDEFSLFNCVTSTDASESKNESKVCSVCGDKALGFNFGALTCESCKAFFRRNAFKQVIPCVFNNNCMITLHTRRFCSFCRLKKCFFVNMKKEKILVKQKKHQQNTSRSPKATSDTNSNAAAMNGSKNSSMDGIANFKQEMIPKQNSNSMENPPDNEDRKVILSPINLDVSQTEFQTYTLDTVNSTKESTVDSDVNTNLTDGNNHDNNYTTDTLPSFSPTVITSVKENARLISLNDSQTREGLARLLNEDEWNLLANLYQSYMNNFINSGSMPLNQIATASLNSLINSSGFIVRRFINYAKQITEFIKLEQTCQIALLKGAVLNSIIIRSMIEFNIDQGGWVTPQGIISSDVFKAAGLNQLYQDYITYFKSFASVVGSDDYLIALVQVLCLFSSENMYITQRQIISDIHDKYLILLKHYLEATYGFNQSKPMLISIMSNLVELQNMTVKHGQILLHVDPSHVDPLMIEVFNMNISNYFKD